MPSFSSLKQKSPQKFSAMVDFLSQLKSGG
jgi:hypothetical protein